MTISKLSNAARRNANQTFGLEIEIVCDRQGGDRQTAQLLAETMTGLGFPMSFLGYTHRITSDWKIVTDASVDGSGVVGLELVSPIMKGQDDLTKTGEMLAALNTIPWVKINTSCGIHVHLGAEEWSIGQHKAFASMFVIFENALLATQPDSRLNSRWCRPVTRSTDRETLLKQIRLCTTTRELGRVISPTETRYMTLNHLGAMSSHGTVECRMHAGSIDQTKITAWVSLMLHVAGRALLKENKNIRLDARLKAANNKDTLNCLVARMRKSDADFFMSRYEVHGARREAQTTRDEQGRAVRSVA